MHKIGIITSPLNTGHAIRGVGFYTKNLINELNLISKKNGIEIVEINELNSIANSGISLLHYPFFDLFFSTLIVPDGINTITTIHDIIPLEYPDHYPPGIKGTINLFKQKRQLTKVKRVITDSAVSAGLIHTHLNVPKDTIRVIYLGISEIYKPIKNNMFLKSISQKYQLPEKFILYVGDINYNKNIPTLIAACHRSKTPLVLVGRTSKDIANQPLNHPEFRHLTGVNFSDVTRLGFVPDEELVGVYNLATVYCQPSFAEGFGLTVLEALSCGTPVISSRSHSLPEVAGLAALYFDPNSISDLASQIQGLMTNPKLQKHLSLDGQKQAKLFSLRNMAENTLKVYQELL